ncbi:MAG: hypothetical protein RJA22_1781 [Verrucomicrobiota bacterium]|jgi:anti-anti-sigma regulatory factor
MSALPPSLSVWVADDLVCLRITGRAACAGSVDFRRLMLGLREKGHVRFLLDLSQCQLMDSTFLGVMAWLVLQFSEGPVPARIELLNPSARIAGLLDNLGVAHLFPVHEGGVPRPEGAAIESAALPAPADRAEVARTSLEAHELLSRLDPRNAARFKDVVEFLREDLEKLARKGLAPLPPASADLAERNP